MIRCAALVSPLARLLCAPALALALLLPLPGPVSAQGEGAWTPIPTAGAPSARYAQAAVWTGKELLIWGGRTCVPSPTCTAEKDLGDGAAYNPATRSWRRISSVGVPSPRAYAAAVWTGNELLIWGGTGAGYLGDGAAYNPMTNTWRPLPSVGAPSPRERPAAVWTGRDMLIWGGSNAASGGALHDGGAYDPSTNAWFALPSPRSLVPQSASVVVWTGERMLLWGCCAPNGAASFDPAIGVWSSLPSASGVAAENPYVGVWTGSEALIWGASGATRLGQPLVGKGAAFDPAMGRWSALPTQGAPSPRFSQEGVWTGTELLVWGGFGEGYTLPREGAAFTPTTYAWRPLPTDGAPAGRCFFSAVWTGAQMLIWGGSSICDNVGVHPLGDGAAYTPPAGPACRFVLGFATLHDALPDIVGDCLDDEAHNPVNGDGLQHTTGVAGAGGLLVWRKADNWTAFTDGYHTWVNGPTGLEYRLNTQRFAWEANPDGLPMVPDAHVGASQFAQPGPRLRLVDTTLGYVQGPLTFRVAGGGFRAGETVTIQGSYTPAYVVSGVRRTCSAEALGPVQVTADATGSFTATVQAARNFQTGGDYTISATGSSSGTVRPLAGGAGAAQIGALPAGCGY